MNIFVCKQARIFLKRFTNLNIEKINYKNNTNNRRWRSNNIMTDASWVLKISITGSEGLNIV